MLKRFHEELTAWSADLSSPDKQHVKSKAMLADPEVAVFLASRNLTADDDNKYTITSESPEEVKSQCEEFFRKFRELRRRGRTIDEFALKLTDKKLSAAIQTLSGKLVLNELVERSAKRPDVDGLQLWVDAHFEETAEGLKLHDWAGDEINGILEEAAKLEEQLSKTYF